MDFIFMLTQGDKTIPDPLEVAEEVLPLGLTHIGFKDIGVDQAELSTLTNHLKDAGVTTYLEVVSETPEAALKSARMARELGIDRLLGGTDVAAVQKILAGSDIAYYPFPGQPVDHPTVLKGSAGEIAANCQNFMAQGAAGVDLLAYRALDEDPLILIKSARAALPEGDLIIAGSIDSPERIAALEAAGVDAFTIGSAIFDGSFAPNVFGIAAQVESVLACLS